MAPFWNGSVFTPVRFGEWRSIASKAKRGKYFENNYNNHHLHIEALPVPVSFVLRCTSTSHSPFLALAIKRGGKKSIEVADNNKRKKCLQTRVQKCGYVSHCASLRRRIKRRRR